MRRNKRYNLAFSFILIFSIVLSPISVFADRGNLDITDRIITPEYSEIVLEEKDMYEENGSYYGYFPTNYEKNYFRVWFKNESSSRVLVYLESQSEPDKTYWPMRIDPGEDDFMEFKGIRPDYYRVDVSTADGSPVMGHLRVRVGNGPLD